MQPNPQQISRADVIARWGQDTWGAIPRADISGFWRWQSVPYWVAVQAAIEVEKQRVAKLTGNPQIKEGST